MTDDNSIASIAPWEAAPTERPAPLGRRPWGPRLSGPSAALTPDGSSDQPWLVEFRRDPRLAITDTGVVCLVCGDSFRHLTNTHLRKHGLTSGEYKERFGYNTRRALMIARVRRTHSDNASTFGLALRIRRHPLFEDIELRRMGGRRRHTLEELLTRREHPMLASFHRDDRGRFAVPPDSRGRPV